ncbi:hypothetical protein JCM10049v2_000968 [Rhodotorula toruloides]
MGADKERFTTGLPEHLLCEICLGVSYPPMVLCAQEHIACEGCLAQIQASPAKNRCPMCQQAISTPVRASLALKRAIEGYKYTCRHGECDWTGAISDEEGHARDCGSRLVRCYRCDDSYMSKDWLGHWRVCAGAFVSCPEGRQACVGTPEDCGFFKRRDLQAHLENDCTQRKCRVTKGCNTRTTYANLPDHEAGCSAAAKRIQELEEALREKAAGASPRKTPLHSQNVHLTNGGRSDGLRTPLRECSLPHTGGSTSRKRTLDFATDSAAIGAPSSLNASSVTGTPVACSIADSLVKKQRRSSGA